MIDFISHEEANIAPEDVKENIAYAQIHFDGDYETFSVDTSDWSKEEYSKQWKHALSYSLKYRANSVLLKDFNSKAPHGIMRSFVYIVIPEEDVDWEKWMSWNNRELESITEIQAPEDFYIIEQMIYATTNLEILNSNAAFELLHEENYPYLPIYYINTEKLEWFYSYFNNISSSVKDIWHAKISGTSINKYSKLLETSKN